MTIREILKEAQAQLSAVLALLSNEARLEVQILLQHCLNVNRPWLMTHENDMLEPSCRANFNALLRRRLAGEPIAYILGKREFYGLEFKVTPDTLIPRPDTETLVEAALSKIPSLPSFPQKGESSNFMEVDSGLHRNDVPSILDLGTGTGAIAVAIAKHCPYAQVIAVDQSSAALAVAEENAWNLGARNVQFASSNWFSALADQVFDFIVSNPPYVAENDPHLKQGDLRFEPVTALTAGKDGLDDIRHIISHAPAHLAQEGWLMLEHGHDQAEHVSALLCDYGFVSVDSAADLSGILRVTYGKISS